MPYTPDPALVRRVTELVIDEAITELRDTGPYVIGEIGRHALAALSGGQRDAAIQAASGALDGIEISYTFPGEQAITDAATVPTVTVGTVYMLNTAAGPSAHATETLAKAAGIKAYNYPDTGTLTWRQLANGWVLIDGITATLITVRPQPVHGAPTAETDQCACHRSPFDHENGCPQAFLVHCGIKYRTDCQYRDDQDCVWRFWGADDKGRPLVQIAPFGLGPYAGEPEPMLLADAVDEYGPFVIVPTETGTESEPAA